MAPTGTNARRQRKLSPTETSRSRHRFHVGRTALSRCEASRRHRVAGERPDDDRQPRHADHVGLQAEREHHRERGPSQGIHEPPEQRQRPGDEQQAADRPVSTAELRVGRLPARPSRASATRSRRRCRGRSPTDGGPTVRTPSRRLPGARSSTRRWHSSRRSRAAFRMLLLVAELRRREVRPRPEVRVLLDEGEPHHRDGERQRRRRAGAAARRARAGRARAREAPRACASRAARRTAAARRPVRRRRSGTKSSATTSRYAVASGDRKVEVSRRKTSPSPAL